ncbi:response regulator transcription factor [Streptomyces kebangsaanensis]|uniref:response regulator transcription factor n=1 Tax=Streptomyces kebangsaanensis TaxID=864058 RepID=UPI00093E49E7|nr:LuxR C-terminal-related transcriptional regulator [Streptomyces kebangsaanensis]
MQTLKATRKARPSRPRSGWEALTPAELQVARLVAIGLSNRAVAEELMVSPHTVNTHVRNAFLKLGVSSRVQLTRQVLRHEADNF